MPGQKKPVRHDVRLNRLTLAACGALIAGEAGVAIWLNQTAGLLLIVCTATLLVGIRSTEMLAARNAPAPPAAIDPHALFTDERTGLPNHQRLIEEVTLGVARARRHGAPMTIVRVDVERLADLRAAWGAEVASDAVAHTAGVLGRVARATDFVASLGDGRFAVVLPQANRAQGAVFAGRVALAATNRPLESEDRWRLPIYVAVATAVLEFDAFSHRGAFDFLAAAGCDAAPASPQSRRGATGARGQQTGAAPVRDYYADDAPAADFAQAYRDHLKKRVG
ncbi:MAG: diguanylate cyclase [Chloroflexi bacterium]|nr:diguanylate cyclase [Chloroflexota bacterium]